MSKEDVNNHPEGGRMSWVTSVVKPIFDAPDFSTSLRSASHKEAAAHYDSEAFVEVQPGCGYCMDDRPVKGRVTQHDGIRRYDAIPAEQLKEKELLKPAFVGGAAGWAVMFMMMGQDFSTAFANTSRLYQTLGWGRMEGHIDDEHGHLDDESILANREAGCGFLGVWTEATALVRDVLGTQLIAEISPENKKPGADFLSKVLDHDGVVVVLAGNHDNNAPVVVNLDPSRTLNRTALFAEMPAFAFDAGAMTADPVRTAFNELSGTQLSAEEFLKIQAALHVVTGFLLNVFTEENISQKLVVVPQAS